MIHAGPNSQIQGLVPAEAPTREPQESTDLTTAQLSNLADADKQTEYLRQFHLQMKRRECPGCGE